MLQLKKNIPFEAGIAVFPDEHGVDALIISIKATFSLNGKIEIAEEQIPLILADEYWGKPGYSSLKYASEVHLPKPTTDVVLLGHAQTPDRRPVQQLDVILIAGKLRKVVRVIGDRLWVSSRPTPPKSFEVMPLVYERAYGGSHKFDNQVLFEHRNPVGTGFIGKRKNKEFENLPLPNLEDPQDLISSPSDLPTPAGFGYIAPSWQPRVMYAGTYDEQWQKNRAPFLPDDFDLCFFNAAHPELISDNYFKGGEPIQVVNASPNGPIEFRLPTCRFMATVHTAGTQVTPPLNLETVLIEPDAMRFCLLWRAILTCDKSALKINQIDVDLEQLNINGR